METIAHAGKSRGFLLEFLRSEGLLVAVVVAYAAALSVRLPLRISQDTWLTLVGGREIIHNGLPGSDDLTYWTAGEEWIDQQWLAHLGAYGLYATGGVRLVALLHVFLVTLALGLAVYGARDRGAGTRATAWVTAGAIYPLVLTSGHVRAQSLAYPLFVIVLLLLLRDVRAPSNRVLLVLPLLALWANLHGSALVGAALVIVRGLTLAAERRWPGALALIAGSVLAVFATPWGLRLADYYRETLLDPSFRNLVTEWRPLSLTVVNLPLFALAAFAAWLLGRCHRSFAVFESLSVLVLVLSALASFRNGVWLVLGVVPLLAPALSTILPDRQRAFGGANLFLGLGAIVFAVVAMAYTVERPRSAFTQAFPPRAAEVVARAADQDPSIRVYADVAYADWLLFTVPQLRGRIAYDARFELLSAKQIASIVRWRTLTTRWREAARGARLLVLDGGSDRAVLPRLLADPGVRTLYRDRRVIVLVHP